MNSVLFSLNITIIKKNLLLGPLSGLKQESLYMFTSTPEYIIQFFDHQIIKRIFVFNVRGVSEQLLYFSYRQSFVGIGDHLNKISK